MPSSWFVRVLTLIATTGWDRGIAVEVGVRQQVQSLAQPAGNGGLQRATALLLALEDGQNGENHLREWATDVQSSTLTELPPVWVVCIENSESSGMVANLAPQFQPCVVKADASWDAVLRNFALQVGLAKTKSTQSFPGRVSVRSTGCSVCMRGSRASAWRRGPR